MSRDSSPSSELQPQEDCQEEFFARQAFLLGLYIELPAVDTIIKPLVRLSPMLCIPKVVLLDAALARLGAYDVERSSFSGAGNLILREADERRRDVVDFLHSMEVEKVKTIADLLWNERTELANWYRAGRAVRVVVHACDRGNSNPTQQAIEKALNCLKRAASYRKCEPTSEIAPGLTMWLEQMILTPPVPESGLKKAARKKTPPPGEIQGSPSSDNQDQSLRVVESLASEIRDLQEDTRSLKQRLRDERDAQIYEKCVEQLNSTEVRTIINRKIMEEQPLWEKLTDDDDIRKIASCYANRFNKDTIPRGSHGRPRKSGKK